MRRASSDAVEETILSLVEENGSVSAKEAQEKSQCFEGDRP